MGQPNWAEIWSAYSQWAGAAFGAISAFLVLGSLVYTAKTFNAQKLSTDAQSMLAVWAKLDEHWVRFQAANDNKHRFEFGQLISTYEIACALFRNDVFTTASAVILAEHLRDVLGLMKTNDHFKGLFESLKTQDHTYEHIFWFIEFGPKKIEKLKYQIPWWDVVWPHPHSR